MSQPHITLVSSASAEPASPPMLLEGPVINDPPAAPAMGVAQPAPPRRTGPVFWATVATLVWLALITATVALLVQGGSIGRLDATNILAIGGSVFAPLSFFWLIALTSLRSATLHREQERLEQTLATLLAPLERAQHQAAALLESTDREISRLQNSAQVLDARVQLMVPPLDSQIRQLDLAAERLSAVQQQANQSAAALEVIVANITNMADQVATRLPEAAASVSHASTEVALHGEHLESAARTLTQVVGSARDSMAQLLPMLARVTFQTHEASESLSLKLSDLRQQAEESNRRLDQAGDKASSLLENSRRWIDGQIETVELQLARMEGETSAKINALASQIGLLDSGTRDQVGEALDELSARIESSEAMLAQRLETMRGEWQQLSGTVESLSTGMGSQLLDAMARARAVAAEAMVAARDASKEIVETAEAALSRTSEQARHLASETMTALQLRASTFAQLASEAEAHSRALRDAQQQAGRDDLGRMATRLLDSLNNASIDLAKIMTADVSDEEWRSYLQGDRSLFTRRLARLADRGSESRVAELLRNDTEMRTAVSRFVQGFEALLKLAMAGAQGDSFALALLSSDWGRLYVLLSRASGRL